MMPQSDEQRENPSSLFGDPLVTLALTSLLLLALGISLWNSDQLRRLGQEVVAAPPPSGVFLRQEGWRIGKLAPDVPLQGADGRTESFRTLAERYSVIYFATDTCPVCQEQFADLSRVAAAAQSAGGSFAMVAHLRETSLANFLGQHRFDFPVYQIHRTEWSEFNLRAIPAVAVFQRGVLSDAFTSASPDWMIPRIANALKNR